MITPVSPLRVREGQRVSFECIAEGSPSPSVSWQSARRRLDPSNAGSAVFDIASVTRADAGIYVCVAQNSAGRSEGRLELVGK